MENNLTEYGQVITFYSYKGGTGRTMNLANIAYLLAKRRNKKVLVIDWDLEAPGLDRYFDDFVLENQLEANEGLIDFFIHLRDNIFKKKKNWDEKGLVSIFEKILNKYISPTLIDGLSLIKAGKFDEHYSDKIRTFD